jgi:hypothetical protein
MNQPSATTYDRQAPPDLCERQGETTDFSERKATDDGVSEPAGHAVIPESVILGEVVSGTSSEKIVFELKLVDGRTLRGRLYLRVTADRWTIRVRPLVKILGVRGLPG